MLSLRGKEGFGHGVGILTFWIQKIQIPHPPEQNNRVKIPEGGQKSFDP